MRWAEIYLQCNLIFFLPKHHLYTWGQLFLVLLGISVVAYPLLFQPLLLLFLASQGNPLLEFKDKSLIFLLSKNNFGTIDFQVLLIKCEYILELRDVYCKTTFVLQYEIWRSFSKFHICYIHFNCVRFGSVHGLVAFFTSTESNCAEWRRTMLLHMRINMTNPRRFRAVATGHFVTGIITISI